MGVSLNGGTPKSSISIGFSIINPWKFNSSPLEKLPKPNGKGLSSNHHFHGLCMLNFREGKSEGKGSFMAFLTRGFDIIPKRWLYQMVVWDF